MDQLRCDRSRDSPNTEPKDDSDADEFTWPTTDTESDAETDPPGPTLTETEAELTTQGTTE